MSIDPWIREAQRICATKISAQPASFAVETVVEEPSSRLLDEAITEAEQSLARFLAARGGAAQELLRARGERSYVLFGQERDGSHYASVFFYHNGLARETGYDGVAVAYSKELRESTRLSSATPRQAAEYFAYYGEGQNDPEKVRGIVAWFTRKVDGFVR